MDIPWPVILLIVVAFLLTRSRGGSDPAATAPHGKVVAVESESEFRSLTSSGAVLVDFFATWCGPCKAIAPVIGKFSETYTNVRFIQVDVDKFPRIAKELRVNAMPTFVLFKDGKPLPDRIVGGNVRALENALKQLSG